MLNSRERSFCDKVERTPFSERPTAYYQAQLKKIIEVHDQYEVDGAVENPNILKRNSLIR